MGKKKSDKPEKLGKKAKKEADLLALATAADPVAVALPDDAIDPNADYLAALTAMQIDLVKLQRHWIETGAKILIILEGRDAAGKDGALKAITAHMSPRQTRIVALPKPDERERMSWYFQRYIEHFPASGEAVFFNRSWYNRAGVEPVMGFCTPYEHKKFLEITPDFESVLVRSGVRLFKFYLDLSKDEQAERLADRKKDPLDFWKVGPIDAAAQDKWDDYTKARDEMLLKTNSTHAPWTIVRSNKKKKARLAMLSYLLHACDYPNPNKDLPKPDNNAVFAFDAAAIKDGRLAK
ncbi:MAG: polyphosphate kinase 2 [Caulobacterales bacterium]